MLRIAVLACALVVAGQAEASRHLASSPEAVAARKEARGREFVASATRIVARPRKPGWRAGLQYDRATTAFFRAVARLGPSSRPEDLLHARGGLRILRRKSREKDTIHLAGQEWTRIRATLYRRLTAPPMTEIDVRRREVEILRAAAAGRRAAQR